MTDTTSRTPPLAEYVDLAAIQDELPFNAEWFARRHRPELIRAQAVIRPGGRLLYHPERFRDVAVQVGIANAARDSAEVGG